MPLVNFYKGSYNSDALLNLCKVQGNIVFDNTTGRIYAGTTGSGANEKPKIYGSNVVDATFSDYTLTISTLTGDPITLDFGDVASASQTMTVFSQLEGVMGALNSGKTAPDYTDDTTGILYSSEQGATNPASLVAADLALATAIHDKLNGLDATADADTASGTGYATVTTTTPTADFKVLNSVTETDGKLASAEAYQLKKVAATAEAEDLSKSSNSAAVYDTTSTEISASWITTVNSNALADGDTVDADLNKLDNKIAGLANELISDERVINTAIAAMSESVGLEDDMSLDLSSASGIIDNDTDVKTALIHLANTLDNVDTLLDDLDATADADTASGTGYATVTTTTPTADFKVLNSVTETDGKLASAEAYQLKKVAATAESSDLYKTTNSAAVYDTTATEISSSWVATVNSNALADGDTVDADLNKLDNKIAGLADEVIADEQVINATVAAMSESVGLEDDLSLDLTDASGIITSDTDVKSALIDLADNIMAMDGSATIASKSGDVITLKAGITQTNGVVANSTASNITLANVAATGAASDVSILDTAGKITATNVEGALAELATAIETLNGSFDVIISSDAATTPYGITWNNGGTTVTGTLVASGDTFHKIYLVPGAGGSSPNSYREFITTKSTSGQTVTYGWEKLGDIDIDLTGYVKTITLNGKTYAVDSNSVNITLTDVITAITGETAINGGDSTLVAVTATTTKNTTTGANATVLASSVKLEEVADGLTQDSSATYAAGHYVIQNGKLVDASDKSSTGLPTYTVSANDGLTTASDVKAYVTSAIQDARMTWAQWS